MPMAGGGTRFETVGYTLPKPLIEIQGKPFFYWAVQSIVHFAEVEDITFVVLQNHIDNFHIDDKIHEFYPDAKLKVIPQVLNGAVLTCMNGVADIHDDLPILFNDCDHAFTSIPFFEFLKTGDFSKPDAALLTFHSDEPCYSYVRFCENGRVMGTVEKEVVSSDAICGAYYFRKRKIFEEAAQLYLHNCDYQEFFMSGIYNKVLELGQTVHTFSTDLHLSFGTPDEYRMISASPNFLKFER